MIMEITIWGVHAGKYGEIDSYFLSKSKPCIALGWNQMGDLTRLAQTREAFKEKVVAAQTEVKEGAIPLTAGMLYRFALEISVNDVVIYPSKKDHMIHIGRVKGDYEFSPGLIPGFAHRRQVEWLKAVPRTKFSQGALYEVGSAMSLFQVKNYADEYLAVLDGQEPSPEVLEDEGISYISEDIEQNTRDFISKRLSSELKGYPFEQFVAHLLNLIGYKTRVSSQGGDGGIDIVAFKDELGIEPPIIKVQVKSVDSTITPAMVQALYGSVETGEYGLFVALSRFSKQAETFAKSKANLRLIDGEELIDLVLTYYEKMDSKYKAMIPLKNVYIPTQIR